MICVDFKNNKNKPETRKQSWEKGNKFPVTHLITPPQLLVHWTDGAVSTITPDNCAHLSFPESDYEYVDTSEDDYAEADDDDSSWITAGSDFYSDPYVTCRHFQILTQWVDRTVTTVRPDQVFLLRDEILSDSFSIGSGEEGEEGEFWVTTDEETVESEWVKRLTSGFHMRYECTCCLLDWWCYCVSLCGVLNKEIVVRH